MVPGIWPMLADQVSISLLLPAPRFRLLSNNLCTFSYPSHILHHCSNVNPPLSLMCVSNWYLDKLIVILSVNGFSVGSIVLYIGQEKFHNSTTNTLKYVVKQSDATVTELRTVSNCLSAAKTIGVDQIFLPPSVQNNIDRVDKNINGSASTLEKETHDNSDKIQNVLDAVWVKIPTLLACKGIIFSLLLWFVVITKSIDSPCRRTALIIISVVMLLLSAFIGICKQFNPRGTFQLSSRNCFLLLQWQWSLPFLQYFQFIECNFFGTCEWLH